eukprot:scaffold262642_cov12-Tisochrysis_lutea.AAC.1
MMCQQQAQRHTNKICPNIYLLMKVQFSVLSAYRGSSLACTWEMLVALTCGYGRHWTHDCCKAPMGSAEHVTA